MSSKKWTDEELEYLENNWGNKSIKTIAEKLGRTITAVKIKANRIGLGRNTCLSENVTLCQLAKCLGVSYSKTVKERWIKKLGLPFYQRVMCKEKKIKFVKIDEFWEWAEEHKKEIDFSKVEKNILGPEPDWVAEKRKADFYNMANKKVNIKWTKEEDEILKSMLRAYRYTYADISVALSRTENAIKRRIHDLKLKERPIKTEDHIKWTDDEIETLINMYKKGYGFNSIGEKVGGRTARAVESKIYRLKKEGIIVEV